MDREMEDEPEYLQTMKNSFLRQKLRGVNMSRIRSGKHCEIKVVDLDEHRKYISCGDAEMDARAQKAIKVAIDKAKICKKPVAKYDLEAKRAYLEYADGKKKYVN